MSEVVLRHHQWHVYVEFPDVINDTISDVQIVGWELFMIATESMPVNTGGPMNVLGVFRLTHLS